jgi:hypothetical protein
MNTEIYFLGELTSFWVELKNSKTQNEIELIKEAITLRAKVSYYEDQIKKMVTFGKLA